ncbi:MULTISPECIES: hypothetical protein [unclassified Sporosarcina]|nr:MULTISPECIES: hypothetical protein [unclassified Sporosarcina]
MVNIWNAQEAENNFNLNRLFFPHDEMKKCNAIIAQKVIHSKNE